MDTYKGRNAKKEDLDNIEDRIYSMVEGVLKDSIDSDKGIDNKEFRIEEELEKITPQQFRPVLCINNVPFQQPGMSSKMEMNINPGKFDLFKRSNSRHSSGNELINFNQQGLNPQSINIPFGNISLNTNVMGPVLNDIYTSTSSNSSKHSGDLPTKTRPRRHIEENSNYVYNEIDELLENQIKLTERVEEEHLPVLKGNFLKLVTSQNGSRILQKTIHNTQPVVLTVIFEELKNNFNELMIDSYANYFCQKFYGFLNLEQKLVFLNQIKEHIVTIGNSKIGTYPLQAVIDQFRSPKERDIMLETIKEKLIELSHDSQGTHVVEKMIMCFEEDSIKDIYTIILDNFLLLSNNSHGLCVTKKLISTTKNEETIEKIQNIIMTNTAQLIQNAYGNYTIQVALESWNYTQLQPIIKELYPQFFSLSMQKYSSNVVEKCLEKGGEIILTKFIDEICQKSKVAELIKNSFGNYVVQKALKLSSGFHKVKLTNNIKKNLEKLNDKKLMNKWKSILMNLSANNLISHTNNNNNLNKMMNVNNSSNLNDSRGSNNSFNSNNSSFSNISNFSNPSPQNMPSSPNFNYLRLNSLPVTNSNIFPTGRNARSQYNSPNHQMMNFDLNNISPRMNMDLNKNNNSPRVNMNVNYNISSPRINMDMNNNNNNLSNFTNFTNFTNSPRMNINNNNNNQNMNLSPRMNSPNIYNPNFQK